MSQPSPPPNMMSVLSSTAAVLGFLRSAGPKGFTAYDADGQLLGLFGDKEQAVRAVYDTDPMEGLYVEIWPQ